ncbi:MAG: YihY family inner membrane protein [Halioglobus sp.]
MSQSLFHEGWRRVRYLVSRFAADRCSENAAALTYMSLFALVPLLTVLYTMASAIPAFQGAEEQMQTILFKHLVPQSSANIEQYLNDFSQQAKNLTGPGIGFLLVTAILMLRNIEHAFNFIWRAREHRSPLSSFLLYWAVLTLTPVTIGLALGLSTYLSSVTQALENFDILGTKAFLIEAAPLVLSTIGFSLIYAAVPNCPVPLKHAVIGGVFAAMAFHAARGLFTKLVVGSSVTFIYGAFAAVPLFLMWIYLSWNIVLLGGILVHSLSAYESDAQANRPIVLKALDVLHVFWQKQQSGESVREMELLKRRHDIIRGLDSETWRTVRDILLEKHVITETSSGHYLLSRDLHTVTFWQLKEWIEKEQSLTGQEPHIQSDWQRAAYTLLVAQRMQQHETLSANLVELFER